MTLKIRILRCSRRSFILLVSVTLTLFSEKMLISYSCIHGFMPNLHKKSWMVSNIAGAGLVARAAFVAITFIMGDLWCTRTISLHLSRRGFFFSLLTILFFSSYLYLSLLLSLSSCCVPWWGLTHTHLVSHTHLVFVVKFVSILFFLLEINDDQMKWLF